MRATPTPNPLHANGECSLPYPLDFCPFVPLFRWGGVPFFRMWERLAAFVSTFHSYLKKALSPDNNTLARGVPKGFSVGPVALGHAGRAKKSSEIVLNCKIVYSFCPVSAFRARTLALGASVSWAERTLRAATPAVGTRSRALRARAMPPQAPAFFRRCTESRSFRKRG